MSLKPEFMFNVLEYQKVLLDSDVLPLILPDKDKPRIWGNAPDGAQSSTKPPVRYPIRKKREESQLSSLLEAIGLEHAVFKFLLLCYMKSEHILGLGLVEIVLSQR